MTPLQLYNIALEAKEQGTGRITLVFSRTNRRPKGFPRGELLSETEQGKVYEFSADEVIEWLWI
jgi:hypothetical protein